jgi:tRNA pseudouridine38-40 synthase
VLGSNERVNSLEIRSGRRLALVVEYDGTEYAGFQLQLNAPTIQGEIEKALKRFTGENIRIRAASRTDSGAHALGQVVDFVSGSTRAGPGG